MKRIIKQIVAIAVAITFVASIMFFIPQMPNNNPLTYGVFIPTNLINITYRANFLSGEINNFSGVGGGLASGSIANVIAGTNTTNFLSLVNFVLKGANLSYNESNGRVICINSKEFIRNICDNSTYDWLVFYGSSAGSFLPYDSTGNISLSSIKLSSIQQNETLLLIYYNLLGKMGTTGGGIPRFPG
jgi:hypothetical protein